MHDGAAPDPNPFALDHDQLQALAPASLLRAGLRH
jgi:hypothetical protein